MVPFKYYIRSTLFIGSILIGVAFAAGVVQKFPTDTIQFGAPGSDNKEVIFDTGDGGSNAKISVDDASPSFSLNKATDVTGAFSATGAGTFGGSLNVTGSGSFTTTGQFGGSINSDGNSFTFGDGLGTNKTLTFDIGGVNPIIRWNQAEVALEFSNDGTNFKKIGSGSGAGGGINLLAELNADFEAGNPPSNWTASGGSYTQDITDPLFDKKSGVFNASALSQTLTSAVKVIERGMIGRKCSANLYYKYPSPGVASDYLFQVRLNGSTTIAEVGNGVTSGDNVSILQVFFDCPSVETDTLSVRLIANVADPGAITVDNAFVGSDKNTFQLSQAEMFAAIDFSSCNITTTSGSVADLAAGSGCTIVPFGKAVPVTNEYRLRVASLPPGRYQAIAMIPGRAFGTVATNCEMYMQVTGGVSKSLAYGQWSQSNSTADGPNFGFTYHGQFNNTTTVGQTDIKFQWRRTAGAGTCSFAAADAGAPTALALYRYPTTSVESLNLETTGWFFDGNIGGAVVDLSTGSVGTYSTATNAGLDLVTNSGSVPGRIVCNANPSTGSTCAAGNEEMGVSVDIPQAGLYEACFEFGHYANIGASSELITIFQVVRTADATGTIVEEGKSRQQHDIYNTGTNTVSGEALNVCGTFNIPSAGRHAFRLFYEQNAAGTINASHVQLDRSAAHGQRDLHIRIRPLNQQMPAPVFAELKTKVDAGTEREFIGRLYVAPNCNTGSCTVGSSNGNWFTSIARTSPGQYLLTFTGTFSGIPTCVFTGNQDANWWQNTTTQNTFQFTTGTGLDGGFQILCMGQKL